MMTHTSQLDYKRSCTFSSTLRNFEYKGPQQRGSGDGLSGIGGGLGLGMGPTVDGTEFIRGQKDEDEEVEESIQEEIC